MCGWWREVELVQVVGFNDRESECVEQNDGGDSEKVGWEGHQPPTAIPKP